MPKGTYKRGKKSKKGGSKKTRYGDQQGNFKRYKK